MNVKHVLYVTTFLLLFLCSCKKQEYGKIPLSNDTDLKAKELTSNQGVGVVKVDRLRFRSENDLHSRTLRYLDQGTIVDILARDQHRVRIGEMEDYWYKIQYDGITGWVFGYFLDLYSSYDSAVLGAEKYAISNDNDSSQGTSLTYYEDAINNHLYFLRNGKIVQVINGREGLGKILQTTGGQYVVDYYFHLRFNGIFYLTRQSLTDSENGALYYYDPETEKNTQIRKNIYAISLEKNSDLLLFISLQKSYKKQSWQIGTIALSESMPSKIIATIPVKIDLSELKADLLSQTIYREKGTLVELKRDRDQNFIYFKPPDSSTSYLVSLLNGSYIEVEYNRDSLFTIDDSRYIEIYTHEDDQNNVLYTIMLKDAISGSEKHIIQSKLYPINYTLSPRKNFLAISMIDTTMSDGNWYPSSVYVLSLSTYSFIPVSTDGISYNPRWNYIN